MTFDKLEYLYLDFLNNYLTIEKFADDYGISYYDAEWILEQGKKASDIKHEMINMASIEALNSIFRYY